MEEKYKASEEVRNIYKMFNVTDQREKMKKLPKKDLYYLLLCCMDNHDEDQMTVIQNYSEFNTEIDDILYLQENDKTTNPYLMDLVKETGSTWVSVEELEKPYTMNEVRELKLNDILEK
jgi:hypothetical protein